MNTQLIDSIQVNGACLEVRERGAGDPVVFVHGAMGDECAAVVKEPSLTNRYRVIDYHRRGYGRSEIPAMPVSVAQGVADLHAILRQLGVKRAHCVGQSYGGVILLQAALDHPETVQSLVLLEPALPQGMAMFPDFAAAANRAGTFFQAGDKRAAMEAFGEAVGGAALRSRCDETLPPGHFERWVADADTVFLSDLVSLGMWRFGEAEAARITQPVLNAMGASSNAYFRWCFETLKAWLPHAENYIVPDASHGMLQMNPKAVSEQLNRFFGRHALSR